MTRNGFDYTPPPFEDPYRSWPANRPMSYIDVLIPIDEQQIARGLYLTEDHRGARQQPPNPGFDKLDEAGRRRYSAMAGTCSPLPGSYEYEFPQASLDLAWKLEKTLANILATSDVLRDMATSKYPACMAAAGYPVKDRKQLAEHVRGKHFEGIEAAAELNAAYEAEVAAARADALCRKDSYPLAMRLIAPVLPEFEKEHSTKIAEVEAHWSNIRDKAKRARAELTW
ncbi:hypothetical protein [Catelliglobosispora koreensis]|uniref:hypothetical protein n=1 Tax=Catelliglobosispora koreensis TaxID=129052 RepID=UPI0003A9158F|nr:hypothetical protein [Catelliglobosispora koreensis]